MGSAGVAAWIARLAFIGLLIIGLTSGELRTRGAIVFLTVGVIAWLGLPYLLSDDGFVTPALAIIDIALVLVIYKGDIRIT